jgi:predicted lactoylglutathione lyase
MLLQASQSEKTKYDNCVKNTISDVCRSRSGTITYTKGASYDQFDSTIQSLKYNGVIIDGEPRDWGQSVSVYFRDPDDHQLEINFARA